MKLVAAGQIIDGTGRAPMEGGYVAVDQALVKDVVRGPTPDGATDVIDLGDLTLLPGFVDTHIHITGSGTLEAREGLATEGDDRLMLRAAANSQTMLRVGVTTARDCGSKNSVIFPFRDSLRTGITKAPRLLVAGAVITPTGGHAYIFGRETDGPMEMRKAVREQAKAGADFIKIMTTGGILTQFKPDLLQFDLHELKVAVREAHELGLHVASHCHNKAGMSASVTAGVDTIEHGIYLDSRGVRYDKALARRIRDSGIFVNPSNAFAVHATLTGKTSGAADQGPDYVANLRAARVVTWQEEYRDGVALVPGSDAGWYATRFEHFARIPELMVTEIGMSPMDAVVACTRTAADAIHLGHQIGSLERGKFADMIAVEGDPVTDINALWNVRWVMLNGEVVWPDRKQSGRPPIE